MKLNYIYFIFCLLILSSCAPQQNLVYFSEGTSGPRTSSANMSESEVKIQVNDILKVSVSSLSAESNTLFNSPSAGDKESGYRVDKNGQINFPVLGAVKLEGLTLEQAQNKLARELDRYVKNPIVNIQYINFKITVMGEVNRPSSFTITDEKVNLMEALGMAGDLTPFGKRDNVLVLREKNGERTMARINLNNRDVLNSPYFYLKQNDIVYVEPTKAKAASVNPNKWVLPVTISAVLSLATILSRVLIP